ncbi:MAG TPA: PD-(D/E)XK nuclease family protein [Myxococcaceae bacterium]|nr:PD-(D/E)XK nuclease family protein [Myxococcaceae bacterium]
MARIITNDFSWSKSRHEKFSECLRAYYLSYYRSWGGWADDAPEDVRQLYVLKKLSNRYTWAGSVVHDAIKNVLLELRVGRSVDPNRVIDRAHHQMREDYKHSSRKAYWREKNRRDFSGLVEHEYAEGVAPEEWKRNWEAAKAALTWFLGSRWMEVARTLPKDRWLEVDNKSFDETVFQLDGVRVFAIPDFAYVDDDGAPVVVDWKTGRMREGYDEQVLGYALYLSIRYGFPVEKVKAALVYLNDGLEQLVQVDLAAIESFKGHFRRSVGLMRELLVDPAGNVPRPEAAFPMTDNVATCGRCVFRRVCGRDGVAAKVA